MNCDDMILFENECKQNIKEQGLCRRLKEIALDFIKTSSSYKYSYNYKWLGVPIIQFPQDIIAMQEIIWDTKPDLIIETGVARGGSIIFYASIMQLINNNGKVLGVDVDIRKHNKIVIKRHPLYKNIKLIEGSSTNELIIDQIKQYIDKNRFRKTFVILDSMHTHDHVLKELELYSMFVTKASYIVVFDTLIEDLPDTYTNRPWGKGNNPKTAVREFLKNNDRFVIDKTIEDKIIITTASGGFLKCVKNPC